MKLIYLEWEDASTLNDGWHTQQEVDDYIKDHKYIIQECGFLYRESKNEIVMLSRINPKSGDYPEQYSVIHKIPKSWIRKRVDLTKYIYAKPKIS